MRTVTHYGLCSLAYSSYILDGMYRVAGAGDLSITVKRRVPDHFRSVAGGHENMQMILLFDATDNDGRPIRFCIDNHDKSWFVHEDLLKTVDLYFKLNHNPDQLDRLNLAQSERQKIRPVASPISPLGLNRWTHRPALRPVTDLDWRTRDIGRRVRHLSRLATYDQIRSLRSQPSSVDVVFVVRIYKEAHHEPINDLRYEIAERLHAHPDINATVGLIGRSDGRYAKYAATEVSTRLHLEQLASSRLGLYVSGPHQCLSFKLAELLALGLPVVGLPIPQDRENLGSHPVIAEQFSYEDPAGLVDGVAKALDDESRLQELSRRNLDLFDTQFAPEPTAKRILDQVLSAVS